jgi:hypothetical protein
MTERAIEMRMARLWKDVVDGRPVLDPDLMRTADQGLIGRVMSYLDGGAMVLRAPTLMDDHLDDTRRGCVPVTFMTDGEWVWSDEHRYYLQQYGILPEPDFLRHMERCDFQTPAVTDAERKSALELLTTE